MSSDISKVSPTSRGAAGAVVKLGGALITNEERGAPVTNRALVISCARELASAGTPVVLVHGTGAYGKPPAVRHGYLDGRLGRDRSHIAARVATDLARLELEVIECLQAGGLHPLRLPALALFHLDGRGVGLRNPDLVAELLQRGITPVIGGGFIVDADGFSVFSSDIVAVDIAIALSVDALVLATKARGVYREFGRSEAIYEQLSPRHSAELSGIGGTGDDVSGGMQAKVGYGFRAAAHGIPTYVVDGRVPGNLAGALAGHPKAGTRLLNDEAIGASV